MFGTALQPGSPFGRNDLHKVGKVAGAHPPALLDRDEAELGRAADRGLGEAAADTRACGDLGKASVADALLSRFVTQDAQHRKFSRGPLAREPGRQGSGGRQTPSTADAGGIKPHAAFRPGREKARIGTGKKSTGCAARAAFVDRLGKTLRFAGRKVPGGMSAPKRPG